MTETFVKTVCVDYGITDVKAVKLVHRMATDFGSVREVLTNYAKATKEGLDQVQVLSRLTVGSINYESQ